MALAECESGPPAAFPTIWPAGTSTQRYYSLIATAGFGWVQREGGVIEEIRPGDVIWFAPGERHWHGASPTTAMTYIAIQENENGRVVEWMEKVTDEQYKTIMNTLCSTNPDTK